jgi:hypothetical protein
LLRITHTTGPSTISPVIYVEHLVSNNRWSRNEAARYELTRCSDVIRYGAGSFPQE